MQLGLEVLLQDEQRIDQLKGMRVALLAHPASTDHYLNHSIDLLLEKGVPLTAAFGPQHGLKGDKQDNMVETDHEFDDEYKIPVYSLYGESRRLTDEMLEKFDVLLYDLQDIGARIYTYVTTLAYMLEDCSRAGKALWVLDRPNPIGRPVEGFRLQPGQESFVGLGPIPMRHGLTVGELAQWYVKTNQLDVDLQVIAMKNYQVMSAPDYGWPLGEIPWVNPSPNIPTLNSARCFPGTVLLEGTTFSEGRGTTRALEVMGASNIDIKKVRGHMRELCEDWLQGCIVRDCFFEPTFHKHKESLCQALHLHTDYPEYQPQRFRPFRIVSLFFKAVRELYPDYEIWRDFHYEYVQDRLAIDVINGGSRLREWVDQKGSSIEEFESKLQKDEKSWLDERKEFLLYE